MFVPASRVGFVPVHHFMAGTECWLKPWGSYLVFHGRLAAADMHVSAASPYFSLGRKTFWPGEGLPQYCWE